MQKSVIYCVAVYVFFLVLPCFGDYSGGNGSAENPWRLSGKEDFLHFAQDAGHYGNHFVLTEDVNLAGEVFSSAVIAADCSTSNPFCGVLDGKGHTIRHLRIQGGIGQHRLGLFGCLYGGVVRNLRIADGWIETSEGCFVGLLAGEADFNSRISNCLAEGKVTGDSYLGGLVGINGGLIENCYAHCDVNGVGYCVGGLAGQNEDLILNSRADGQVKGFGYVGGLVGSCVNGGRIYSSCFKGQLTGRIVIGGLVGYGFGQEISNCYALAVVHGDDYVGGLVGHNNSDISNCYAAGDVISYGAFVGGLAGYHYQKGLSSSFWNIETQTNGVTGCAGKNDCGSINGSAGLGTAAMHASITYTHAGWNFDQPVWRILNGDYPKLTWETTGGDIVSPIGVDYLDFAIFAAAWRADESDENWNEDCDIAEPGDGMIDEKDLAELANNWLIK